MIKGEEDKSKPGFLIRTLSDIRLKTDFSEFVVDWNTQEESRSKETEGSCQTECQPWVEAMLLKPIVNFCKRKLTRKFRSYSTLNVHRRQSSQESDKSVCSFITRRAMSESGLNNIRHVKCVAEFSPQKKVCFGASTSSDCSNFEKKRNPSSNRLRPILAQRSCVTAKPDYYMDYPTFKAWRRGSRLSINVCSVPPKLKESKFEGLVKNFISNCVNQINDRSLPDM